jgi:hypothetical protein
VFLQQFAHALNIALFADLTQFLDFVEARIEPLYSGAHQEVA